MADGAFDLSTTYVHLSPDATAVDLPGFSWTPDYLDGYLARFGAERGGRLTGIVHIGATWSHWECHSGGDELVVQLSGRCDVIHRIGGELRTVTLTPGMAVINPRGVWHTSDVHEPGDSLFVVAGRRTHYRPRT